MTRKFSQLREEWRENTRHKLPPITERDRAVIRRYLVKMLARVEANLATHRAILQKTPDDRTRGIVTYLTNYRSALRDLMATNDQRRKYGSLP